MKSNILLFDVEDGGGIKRERRRRIRRKNASLFIVTVRPLVTEYSE